MTSLQSFTHPIGVAIVGAGPGGFYAAGGLPAVGESVEGVFDRLLTP